jgi:alanyl-tRNA synthetase
MDRKELIKAYLNFFRSKGHAIIPSSSLIPENDPSVLFTTAGMHPLVPFLMGQKHPLGKRIANVQKCIRTSDIDEVGDEFHHTFFEMLGNWSFGDYFKKEAIEFSFEFLTKTLKLPAEKLAVTCFEGDKDAPKDMEASEVWLKVGIPKDKIAFMPKSANWWGPAGATGPCGPDTEMFFFVGKKLTKENNPKSKEKEWCEIWNDVFMQYNKTAEGKFETLKQKNVDTGMGVERTLAVLTGVIDDYKTEMFLPAIKKIESLSGKKYAKETKSIRIIADHLKAATFILGDEKHITPSNVDQGYVLRRLIRRAIRHAHLIGIENNFCKEISKIFINYYKEDYKELKKNEKFILEELEKEENKFKETLEKGLKEFDKLAEGKKELSGKDAFLLYQSFGLPLEVIKDLGKEKNIKIDDKGFNKEYEEHQKLSRVGAEKKFKGGLGEISEETTKLHTATHLLNEALRRLVDKNIHQRGSNITPERLRFDFNYNQKLAPEQLKAVEDEVNKAIKKAMPVERKEMSVDEAKKHGAQAMFAEKYGEKVSVYKIGDYSFEICAGPHVKNTKELGKFKIIKEESIAAGIRRIKAILE